MKYKIKYMMGAISAFFIFVILLANSVLASEAENIQPAEIINYQEPVGVNSSLSATLPSYFFQGTHVGTIDGSGGVLFANGTIINVSRTKKTNKPVPITMGDDLRVDGEIWRGSKKGTDDNMPLKISDTVVPTMDNINDLGDINRRWKDLYLSNNLYGNKAVFSGDVEIKGSLIYSGLSNNNTIADSKIYISEDVDSVVPVPSENPITGKTLIGRTGFTCVGSTSWQEKSITLPSQFQTNIEDYVVNITEHLASGASYDYLLTNYNIETPNNSTLKIRATCRSGEIGIGIVDWMLIGY